MTQGEPLDGETAIVTGASAGIGRATAETLAAEGANVVLAARRADRLEDLAAAIEDDHGTGALPVPTDVTEEGAVADLFGAALDAFGSVEVVVSNAGTGTAPGVAVADLDTEQYRTVTAVNVDGTFFVAREAIPHLSETAGVLIFVGSFASRYPRPSSPVYTGTKWWTRGFALSLAGQVGDADVGVTLVNPSEVRTEFGKEFRPTEALAKERFDPGEVTEPEDVAAAVAFAARQEPPNSVVELDLLRRDKFAGF